MGEIGAGVGRSKGTLGKSIEIIWGKAEREREQIKEGGKWVWPHMKSAGLHRFWSVVALFPS